MVVNLKPCESCLSRNSAGIYSFQANNWNTTTICKICIKVKNKDTRTMSMAHSGAFIVNFK